MTNSKSVLITGASRGIGLLTAKTLASAGFRVFAGMRDIEGRNRAARDELESWMKDRGLALSTVELDVVRDGDAVRAVHEIEAETPIDILINNAGVMPAGMTEAYTIDQFKDFMNVNLFGAAQVTQAVLPFMRRRRQGLLIHLSSAAGRLAIPYFGVYCATKWALEAWAETLHYELRDFNIESVLIEPSGHATDLIEQPPAPAKLDVLQGYGPFAEGPERLLKMFRDMFAQGDQITNAQNVADRIKALIDTSAPRPIRTIVGHDMGLDALDASTAPIQAAFVRSLDDQLSLQGAQVPLTIIAEISLKPEFYEAGKAAINAIVPATRSEPGCREFTLLESREDDGKLYLYEIFDDEDALQRHYEESYTKAVFDKYKVWLAAPVVIRKLKSPVMEKEAA